MRDIHVEEVELSLDLFFFFFFAANPACDERALQLTDQISRNFFLSARSRGRYTHIREVLL